MSNLSKELITPLAVLDEAAKEGAELSKVIVSTFTQSIQLAQLALKISNALSPEVMAQVFLPLKGKDFGWRVDKEYSLDVYQDVWTSMTLKGALPVNDEVLVIGGRGYLQKNHFKRRLRQFPGLTDLVVLPGKIEAKPNGMFVEMTATWKLNGKEMSRARIGASAIPVRLNNGQGADAGIGKAERKILADVFTMLTGSDLGDDEDNSDIGIHSGPSATISATIVEEAPKSTTTEVKEALKRGRPKKEVEVTSTETVTVESTEQTPAAEKQETTAVAPDQTGQVNTESALEKQKTKTVVVGHTRSGLNEPLKPVTKEVPIDTPPRQAPKKETKETLPEMTEQEIGLTLEEGSDDVKIESMKAIPCGSHADGVTVRQRVRIDTVDKSVYFVYWFELARTIKNMWKDGKKVSLNWRKKESSGECVVVSAQEALDADDEFNTEGENAG